jgi:hypothetical protein
VAWIYLVGDAVGLTFADGEAEAPAEAEAEAPAEGEGPVPGVPNGVAVGPIRGETIWNGGGTGAAGPVGAL